jgi:hypothetical protein
LLSSRVVVAIAAARPRVTTPAGPPLVAHGIPMFLGRSVAVTAVDRVLSAAAPARPSGHSPRSRRRHSSNSHSVRAAARGLARSGVYEIAFAVLAATVVPCDLVETSRLSGTRRAQPKKLRECDPAHTVSRRRTAYFSSSASRPRVGGVRALWRAPC